MGLVCCLSALPVGAVGAHVGTGTCGHGCTPSWTHEDEGLEGGWMGALLPTLLCLQTMACVWSNIFTNEIQGNENSVQNRIP